MASDAIGPAADDPANTSSMAAVAHHEPSDRGIMRGLRSQLRATPITVRWVALALVLVGGTALTVGALSYARARAALTAAAETRLELLARDLAQALYRNLMGHAADITTWSHLETMVALTFGDVDKQVADLLREGMEADEAYLALGGYDTAGRRVAAVGDPALLPAFAEGPVSARTALAVSQTGRGPLLRLASPVSNARKPEERIGTLVAVLDPTYLLHGVDAGRLGDATSVSLRAADLELAVDAAAPEGAVGERVFTAQATMPVLRGVDAPPFTIDARQRADRALAAVTALRRTLVRSAIAVMLLSSLAGAVFAWRLSVPIRRLTASVQHVAASGRLEQISGVPAGAGEVGVLTEAFNTMLQRLTIAQREIVAQSRLALLGEIAASIVHDVRTPLSVLKTSAQLLGSAQLSAAEQGDLAALIAAEVDRLNRVVTNLADLGRPPPVHRSHHSIRALVERAVAVLRPWAQARGVHLDADGGADLLVEIDPDQLLQGLLNVTYNAVQASRAGGRVVVRWHAEPRWAVIDVLDGGPGFSAEALERAFSPFFTTKPDGTGLGLVITKRIVEAHDGTIALRNGDDGGAQVSLRLPLAA